VSGFSRTVIRKSRRSTEHARLGGTASRSASLFVSPEKRRCALTLTGGRGGPGYSSIAPINDRHPGYPIASVTFDQTAAKRLAPRRFS